MAITSGLSADQRATFWRDGVVRVPGAFSADEAAAMSAVVWAVFLERGLDEDDPRTWDPRAADHLQHLKADPAFHPLLLHTRPINAGTQLRYLLNKDLGLPQTSTVQDSAAAGSGRLMETHGGAPV